MKSGRTEFKFSFLTVQLLESYIISQSLFPVNEIRLTTTTKNLATFYGLLIKLNKKIYTKQSNCSQRSDEHIFLSPLSRTRESETEQDPVGFLGKEAFLSPISSLKDSSQETPVQPRAGPGSPARDAQTFELFCRTENTNKRKVSAFFVPEKVTE